MSKLHRPESLIRRKDSDFMDERGHWWFAFDCPSESRAAERHHHDYLVRDDGAEARCSCPYADWDKRACTLVLCARDIARAEREREATGPPADPDGEHKPAGSAEYDPDPGGMCPRCLGSGAMLDGGNRPYPCERCGGLGRVGPEGPMSPDDLSGWALVKRADPGGATLDAAQADMDTEQKDWILGGKLSPPPWLVAPGERKRRHDEGMRNLYGDA